MSRRVSRAFDVNLRTNQKNQVRVPVQRGEQRVTIVFERSTIERLQKNVDCAKLEVWSGRYFMGGMTFAGGEADFGTTRPGRTLPWSTFTTKIPPGTSELTVILEARQDFDIVGHVDIYP